MSRHVVRQSSRKILGRVRTRTAFKYLRRLWFAFAYVKACGRRRGARRIRRSHIHDTNAKAISHIDPTYMMAVVSLRYACVIEAAEMGELIPPPGSGLILGG